MSARKKGGRVMATVRKLRLALNETQQEFAARMRVGIATIVRYEHSREPRGKALARFEQVAAGYGFDEYAAVFRKALTDELGAPPPMPKNAAPVAKNAEEHEILLSVLTVLREKRYAREAKLIKEALAPLISERVQAAEVEDARAAVRGAIVRYLKKGHPAANAVVAFMTSPEVVAEAVFRNGDSALIRKRKNELFSLLLEAGWRIAEIIEKFGVGETEILRFATDHGYAEKAQKHEEQNYGPEEDEAGL